jgi:hypothetical protein
MPEETLCHLGRNPKKLSYIDEKTGKYIKIICKLKDKITNEQLKYFFNKVYNMKLDQGYSQSFTKNYTTSDLIKCFKEILVEQEIINLKTIYRILNKSSLPALIAVQEFFNMFEIIEITNLTKEEYNQMMTLKSFNHKNNFFQEKQIMNYNSTLIEIEDSSYELSPKPKTRIKVKKYLSMNQVS